MLVRTILSVSVAFLAGTAAHEVTHWAVAKATGARIVETAWLPPSPQVVYDAPSEGTDQLIRASPIALSVPVLVAVILLSRERALPVMLALVAFGVAYIPRSNSDWRGLAEYLKCIAV